MQFKAAEKGQLRRKLDPKLAALLMPARCCVAIGALPDAASL